MNHVADPIAPTSVTVPPSCAVTYPPGVGAMVTSPTSVLSAEALASLNQPGGVATDYINMESMVAAAGLMAAAGVDCPDSSIAASQRVFDLLNQGYHNERHPLANPSLQGHHETDGGSECGNPMAPGDVLAPNPSPTEGVSSPNRPNTPSDNNAPSSGAVVPPYVFGGSADTLSSQTAAATSAALLMAGAPPNAYPPMTAEQIMTLNSNATTNRTTQTAALPPGATTTALYTAGAQPHAHSAAVAAAAAQMDLTSGAVTPGMCNVRSLVEVNAQTDSNHDTPLTIAAAAGNRDIVRELLKSKADIEHKDKKGFTPLILAASGGHVDVVRLLLETEAQLEATSERTKDTALSLACSGGKEEVVRVLLEKGANIEHRNVSDYTPLSLAASGGYIKIIEMLLTSGAEINSRTGSKLGISPLMLAAMNGHTEAVKLLLDNGSDINAQIESNRNTALTLACYQGRHEVVSLLLERRANMEHRAKSGLTPLMEAASGGYADVGRVLLDHGADVNAPPVPASRDTALTIAADKGHYNFCEVVVARGANVEARNKKGGTPLWLACNGGHLDVAMMLVTSGADVDAQDNRKISCLMAAFRRGHVKVLRYLVKKVSQFPGNQECVRYIATLSDNDLIKRCNQCLDIITNAKDKQAEQANKNAKSLLQELDDEKSREEKQKEAAARKREKRKQKKKQQKGSTNQNASHEEEAKGSTEEDDVTHVDNHKTRSSAGTSAGKHQSSSANDTRAKDSKGGGGGTSSKMSLSAASISNSSSSAPYSSDCRDLDEEDTDLNSLLGLVESVSLTSSGNSSSQTAANIRSANGNTTTSGKKKNKKESGLVSSTSTSSNGATGSNRRQQKATTTTTASQQNPPSKTNSVILSPPEESANGLSSSDNRKNAFSRSANARNNANVKSSSSRSTSGGKQKNQQQNQANENNTTRIRKAAAENDRKQVQNEPRSLKHSESGKTSHSIPSDVKNLHGAHSAHATSSGLHQNNAMAGGPTGNLKSFEAVSPKGSLDGPITVKSCQQHQPMTSAAVGGVSTAHSSATSSSHPQLFSLSVSTSATGAMTGGTAFQQGHMVSNCHPSTSANFSAAVSSSFAPPTSNSSLSIGINSSSAATAAGKTTVVGAPVANSISPRKPGRRGDEGWKEVTVSRKSLISKKTTVPGSAISRVIGRQGCNINAIREATCAHIEIDKQQKGQIDRIVNIRGSADSVKWAEKLIDILIQDPNVDITEHIPKNLAHTLSLSSSGNSGSSASGGGGISKKQSNITNNQQHASNQQPSHFLPVNQNTGSANAYPTSCMQKQSGTNASIYASMSMKGGGNHGPPIGGTPSQPMPQPLVGASNYANQSTGVGVIGSKPGVVPQNRVPNNSGNLPNGVAPSYSCNTNYPSVWKSAATAPSVESSSSSSSSLNGVAMDKFSLLNNILNQGPSTNIWQGSAMADNPPEDAHSSMAFNHPLSAQIDSSAQATKGFSGNSTRGLASQNNQPQMNAVVGGPVKQKTSPLAVGSALSSSENSVPSNKHFNSSATDSGVLPQHNETSSSFFPNSNSMPSGVMDPVVSLQISGNSGGGSSQLNVNSSVNHFQSNSPTSVSSKHRHSSGGSGPGQPPGAVADHFSCSSHHNSPKVSPPISAAPQISSSSAAVANFSHVPQVMTISNQPLPYNPEILMTSQKDAVVGGGGGHPVVGGGSSGNNNNTGGSNHVGPTGSHNQGGMIVSPRTIGGEKKQPTPIGTERKFNANKSYQPQSGAHGFFSGQSIQTGLPNMESAANDMFGLQHGFSHNFDKTSAAQGPSAGVGPAGGLNFSHLASMHAAPNAPNMSNPSLNHPQLTPHGPTHGFGTSQQPPQYQFLPHNLTSPGSGVFNSVNHSPFLSQQPGVGNLHVHPQGPVVPSSSNSSSVGGKGNPQGVTSMSGPSTQVSVNHDSVAEFAATVSTVTSLNSSMRGGPNVDLSAPIASNPSIPNLYSQANVNLSSIAPQQQPNVHSVGTSHHMSGLLQNCIPQFGAPFNTSNQFYHNHQSTPQQAPPSYSLQSTHGMSPVSGGVNGGPPPSMQHPAPSAATLNGGGPGGMNHMTNGFLPPFVPQQPPPPLSAASVSSSSSLSVTHSGIISTKDLGAAMQHAGAPTGFIPSQPPPHLGMDCDNVLTGAGEDRTSAGGAPSHMSVASQYPSAADDQLFSWSASVLQ